MTNVALPDSPPSSVILSREPSENFLSCFLKWHHFVFLSFSFEFLLFIIQFIEVTVDALFCPNESPHAPSSSLVTRRLTGEFVVRFPLTCEVSGSVLHTPATLLAIYFSYLFLTCFS